MFMDQDKYFIENELNEWGENDLSPKRVFKLSKGYEVIGLREDPFGFFTVELKRDGKKTKLPQELKGEFTTYDAMKRAIDGWVNKKNILLMESKDTKKDFKESEEE